MQVDDVQALQQHAAWRLLRADDAPLVVAFLARVFTDGGAHGLPAGELADRLADLLAELDGTPRVPVDARGYLDGWAGPDGGWLRAWYPPGSDEPLMDATPAAELAVAFVRGLAPRPLVDTAARLGTVVDQLRALATEDAEPTAQRDRYLHATATATGLLADLRAVEAAFRDRDRELRAAIAAGDGALAADVVAGRRGIAGTDQGRSFHACYDRLLSPRLQDELTDLLDRVHALPALRTCTDPRMRRIRHDLVAAAQHTRQVLRGLVDALRTGLDEQVRHEDRRVLDLVAGIEDRARVLSAGLADLDGFAVELDDLHPTVVLPMERHLYAPPRRAAVDSARPPAGEEDFAAAALFDQVQVDPVPLSAHVRRALLQRPRVELATVLEQHPLQHGLAELVAYLSLRDEAFDVVLPTPSADDQPGDDDTVTWTDPDGRARTATLPRVVYARRDTDPRAGSRHPAGRRAHPAVPTVLAEDPR
ncbi:DUF3375 family protein [Klenkia sp. PcliD-1-E]|uniref:DUF3375 family protein n=1 Tax=Klenkia sp. PcliD-1-E TaxID=2954492 RepID=UPI002096A074|nr:DUF3375 family protein [Klenkia sp. PcliD-1-E]MCO7218449.1 DUF3375 domain-containing protein [Klenkia sp. PcliD-1-E]